MMGFKFNMRKVDYILVYLLMLGCGVVYFDYIVLNKVYLFKDIGSDSININFPYLMHLSGYITEYGLPSWTFAMGVGHNLYPFWLSDIMSLLLVITVDQSNLPYGIAYMEVVKIILSGILFYKYLVEIGLLKPTALIFGLLFAFSSYVILGGGWTIFSTEALYAVIMLFGFERWLNKRKIAWFVLGVFLMSLLQPFFLFMYALFFLLYIPARYADKFDWHRSEFIVFFIQTFGLAVLGLTISAFQLLPDVLQYLESPRVSGESSYFNLLSGKPVFEIASEDLRFTTKLRAFGADLLGTGSDYRGWQNYLEAPMSYCGLLCLVAFPQFFCALNRTQKITYGVFSTIVFLPMVLPYIRYAFWLFSGNYFRTYSLMVSLVLLMFSAKAIDNIMRTRKVHKAVLVTTFLFLLWLLFGNAPYYDKLIDHSLRLVVVIFIAIYTVLLMGLDAKIFTEKASMFVMTMFCFIEVVGFSMLTVNHRDAMTGEEIKAKVGYNDYTVEAIKYLKDADQSFFRVDKNYSSGLAMHRSINDAMVQGYFGTSSYNSFNQLNYVRFLGEHNIINPNVEHQTRWIIGLSARPILLTLFSVKYLLLKSDLNEQGYGYFHLADFGDVKVYENSNYLPLGIAYDKVMFEHEFHTLSQAQKDIYLLRGCVVGDDNGIPLNGFESIAPALLEEGISFAQYSKYVESLRKDAFRLTEFKQSRIKGEVDVTRPKILFFSIPYDGGWKATVNGVEAMLYRINSGFLGLRVDAGKSAIELNFQPRLMRLGAFISLIGCLIFIVLSVKSREQRIADGNSIQPGLH